MVAPPMPEHNPVEARRHGVRPGSRTSPALYADAMARPVPRGDGALLKDWVAEGPVGVLTAHRHRFEQERIRARVGRVSKRTTVN